MHSIGAVHDREGAEPEEPCLFEEMRLNVKTEFTLAYARPGKRGSYQEAIVPVPQRVVVHHAAVAGGNPIVVQTFQLVRIAQAFRRSEINARIAELNPS